jgi:hypothetical protein
MRGFSFVPNTTPLAIARSLPLPVRSVSLIAANRGSIVRFGHKNMSMIRKSGNRFFLATNA